MKVTRREFLKASTALGGGLLLEFSFLRAAYAAEDAPVIEVNAWVVIHPDDSVVVRIARSEMGQGTYTALAQLLAEELDCDWSKVSSEFASPNENFRRHRIWGSMSTGGSMGVRSSQDYVRKAGAAARMMLTQAAAARWNVPVAECKANRGIITHVPSGRTLHYGEVAGAAVAAVRGAGGHHHLADPVETHRGLGGRQVNRLRDRRAVEHSLRVPAIVPQDRMGRPPRRRVRAPALHLRRREGVLRSRVRAPARRRRRRRPYP